MCRRAGCMSRVGGGRQLRALTMSFAKFHLGRLLTAAVLLVGLGAIAYAATPAHRPGSGLAAKKARFRACGEKRRAQEGRAADHRAARHPDRRRKRRRAVRARCRQADLSGQPRQADDRRIRVPRTQGGPPQAHRRIHRERERLAQGRRAVARLHHVRRRSTARSASTTCCTASSSSPPTTPASCWPKASPATKPNSPPS